MNDFDLIVGIHSIAAALKNSTRSHIKLVCTEDGKEELIKRSSLKKSDLDNIEMELVSTHKLQEEGKRYYKELELEFQRIPSQIFLLTSPLQTFDNNWLYENVRGRQDLKILCLDQISDVHNGAAILRTASFYGVDIVILPSKRSFGFTPSFYRIASGATEFLNLVQVNSLPKIIAKFNSLKVTTIGLTEHAENPLTEEVLATKQNLCLVLGKEETGISNAVLRLIDHQLSLASLGDIKSLNVSVAAAISMEKTFGHLKKY
jgi:23S rRNA (guanosine2251-2'-O)-methyltransferase